MKRFPYLMVPKRGSRPLLSVQGAHFATAGRASARVQSACHTPVWFSTVNSSNPLLSRLPRYPLTVVTASQ
jgi:hypothetical protein